MPHAEPPRAKKIRRRLIKHGLVRTDDYYWLRERSPGARAYLKAENRYTAAALRPWAGLKKTLFAEMKARVKQNDASVPFKYGPYLYYKAYRGGEYPVYARRRDAAGAAEEVLLDVNLLARGKNFCQVPFPEVSPDHKRLAYAVDTEGRRFYTIRFKDLETGRTLREKIDRTAGDLVWANDSRTLFYVKQDAETLRWERVLAHVTGGGADREVYFEKDETFEVGLAKSETERFIFIRSGATLTTEYLLADANRPEAPLKVFRPRQAGLEYDVADGGDRFFVLHNEDAKNFKVSECGLSDTGAAAWRDLVPHRADTLVEYAAAFERWLVLKERSGAAGRLRVLDRVSGKSRYLDFGGAPCLADIGDNYEYRTDTLRVTYESMTTPDSVFDFDMRSGSRVLKKRQAVLGGFKPERYASRRLWFAARDGEQVPVTLVYRKGLDLRGGRNPALLSGYGAYGVSSDPYFSSVRLSLLDRGFICALVHTRGGSELGRRWYEDGRQLKKLNTFHDFIDATRFLIGKRYTSPGHLYAEGGSAGGLLMGAVANMAPELYKGIIADVPFVDVVTTMLDPDIPLTTAEYDEWGDPRKKKYFDYILAYSPYDNVEKKAYPNLLVTAGLNDSQVQYWEPAKWTAKLRALKTDRNLLLLKTDLDTGHGGKSGRFEALELAALEYSFLLGLEGLAG